MDKKTYIIIIIGVVTILGAVIINKVLKNDSSNDNPNSSSINLVENYSDFFTANGCATKYINYLTSENKEALIKVLNESYTSKNKTKIVVACKDFTKPGIVLQDFASLKNRIIDSERNGYFISK